MNKIVAPGTITSHTKRRSLYDPEIIEKVVNIFKTIWIRSNESPTFSINFTHAMHGSTLSYNSVRLLKEKAIQLKILIPVGNNIRFRGDLAEPNVGMIQNLFHTKLNSPEIKFSDEELVKELRHRGYKVTCEKSIIVKL